MDLRGRHARTPSPQESESLPTPSSHLRRSSRIHLTQADHVRYDLKYHPMDDAVRPTQAASRKRAHGLVVPDDDDNDADSIHSDDTSTVAREDHDSDNEISSDETDDSAQHRRSSRTKVFGQKQSPAKGTRASGRIAKQDTPPTYSQQVHPQDDALRSAGIIKGRRNSIKLEGRGPSARKSASGASSSSSRSVEHKAKRLKAERESHAAKTSEMSIDEYTTIYFEAWVTYTAAFVVRHLRTALKVPSVTTNPQDLSAIRNNTGVQPEDSSAPNAKLDLKVRKRLADVKGVPIEDYIKTYYEAWKSLGETSFQHRLKALQREFPDDWQKWSTQDQPDLRGSDDSELQTNSVLSSTLHGDSEFAAVDDESSLHNTEPVFNERHESTSPNNQYEDEDVSSNQHDSDHSQQSVRIRLFSDVASSVAGRKKHHDKRVRPHANFAVFKDIVTDQSSPEDFAPRVPMFHDDKENLTGADFDMESDTVPDGITSGSHDFVTMFTTGALLSDAPQLVRPPPSLTEVNIWPAPRVEPPSAQQSFVAVVVPRPESVADHSKSGSQAVPPPQSLFGSPSRRRLGIISSPQLGPTEQVDMTLRYNSPEL